MGDTDSRIRCREGRGLRVRAAPGPDIFDARCAEAATFQIGGDACIPKILTLGEGDFQAGRGQRRH